MELIVTTAGAIRCLYSEAIDLNELGLATITRASQVEPDSPHSWYADLSLVGGPKLRGYRSRSAALAAEVDWLSRHWLL